MKLRSKTPLKTVVRFLLAAVLISLALVLIWCAFQPFDILKARFDSWMPDGEFESLTASNYAIFKGLFAAGAVFLLCLTYILVDVRLLQRISRVLTVTLKEDLRSILKSLKPARNEIWYLAILLFITALAVLYRLPKASSPMLHDEAYTFVAFASRSFRTVIMDYHLPNNHVFYTILVYLSTHLFGNQPWVVRLPAFIAGVLIAPAVYFFAKGFYDRQTGLLSALFVAASPVLISYSNNSRGYGLVALLGLMIFTLGEYVIRNRNLAAWLLLSILAALGFYAVPVMLFPFGILFVWLFISNIFLPVSTYRSRTDFFLHWLFSGFLTAILTLLLYLPVLMFTGVEQLFANAFVSPLDWPVFPETLQSRLVETWRDWVHGVSPVLVATMGIGFALSLVFHKRLSRHKVPVQLAAVLWIIALLIVQRPNAWSKVWLFLLPMVIIWSAAGITGVLRRIVILPRYRISLATVLTALAVILITVQGVLLVPHLSEEWAVKGDAENSVIFINEQLQDNDLILVTSPDSAPVWYYGHLYGIPDERFKTYLPFERVFVIVNTTEGQTLESVIQARDIDATALDLSAATSLQRLRDVEIYLLDSQ